jgi:hypothetical protein
MIMVWYSQGIDSWSWSEFRKPDARPVHLLDTFDKQPKLFLTHGTPAVLDLGKLNVTGLVRPVRILARAAVWTYGFVPEHDPQPSRVAGVKRVLGVVGGHGGFRAGVLLVVFR